MQSSTPTSIGSGGWAKAYPESAVPASVEPADVLPVHALTLGDASQVTARPAMAAVVADTKAGTKGNLKTVDLRGKTFADMDMPPHLKELLRVVAYEQATPVQELVLAALFGPGTESRTSLLAQADTGTGKTLCYVLAMAEALLSAESGRLKPGMSGTQVICVLPTFDVAKDRFNYFQKFGLEKLGIKSTLVQKTTGGKYPTVDAHVVFGSPGLLNNSIKRKKIGVGAVRMLVLDEVDKLLKDVAFQGGGGIKEKLQITQRRDGFRTLCFSATMEDQVKGLLHKMCPGAVLLRPALAASAQALVRADIDQCYCTVEADADKARALVELLPWLSKHGDGSIMIFVNERKNATQLQHDLAVFQEQGITARVLTGANSREERADVFDAFKRGQVRVLLTTDVCGRGIDMSDVKLVVHFDLPTTGRNKLARVDYIQRCGRSARYENSGVSMAFNVRARPETGALIEQLKGLYKGVHEIDFDEVCDVMDDDMDL